MAAASHIQWRRQTTTAAESDSANSSESASSTSLRDPSFNICQQALCDNGKRAAFFIPFILLFLTICGFLALVKRRRRARDSEKQRCDSTYMSAHKRGESFDYSFIPSHDPTALPPQYAVLQEESTLDTSSLPTGPSRSSFSIHSRDSSINSAGWRSRLPPSTSNSTTLTQMQRFELDDEYNLMSHSAAPSRSGPTRQPPLKLDTSPGQRSTATFDVEDLYTDNNSHDHADDSDEDNTKTPTAAAAPREFPPWSADHYRPREQSRLRTDAASLSSSDLSDEGAAAHLDPDRMFRGHAYQYAHSQASSASDLDVSELPVRGASRYAGASSYALV